MKSTRTVRTLVTGVAVLAVGAVAWPMLHHARDDSREGDAPAAQVTDSGQLPPGALTGDVDGDGRADVVTLSRTDTLRVRLGSGTTVSHLLQDRPRIEGLADLGGPGLAVVVSHNSGNHYRAWTPWVVSHGTLSPVHTRKTLPLAGRGELTAWVAGHRLYDGTLDPLQTGAERVAVLARQWSLQGGRLATKAVGIRCWDRSSTRPPAVCRAGQDWRFDVGPHGDLPRLLPTVDPPYADSSHATFGSETWLVRGHLLVHQGNGTMLSARVPPGWAPALFRAPVRLADGEPALLLSQEGGDSDTWRVYVVRAGTVKQVRDRGPLPLGGGFTSTGGHEVVVYSWLTPVGRLFTRIGTATPGRFRVYAWLPTGGSASTPPTLVAHDLGRVCIDETFDTYGTC